MKNIVLFILLTSTQFCQGQTNHFFKLWIGTAEFRVEKKTILDIYENLEKLIPFDDDGNIDSVALNEQVRADSIKEANWIPKSTPEKLDTNYYRVHILLEIKENGVAIFKKIGESEEIINWNPTSSYNEIRLDTMILRLDSMDHLSFVILEQDSLIRKVLFEPLSQSNISTKADISSILRKYSWDMLRFNDNIGSKSSLLFENDTLNISIIDTDTATYISPASWTVDKFSGHYFLLIKDYFYPVGFYLHLTEFSAHKTPIISTDHYDIGYPFNYPYPRLVRDSLVGVDLPNQREINKISKHLIGTWKSSDTAFPMDFKHDMLLSFIIYEFKKDGTVTVTNGEEAKYASLASQIERKATYDWSLSSNGKLIIFEMANSASNIAYFRFLDSNNIEIRKQMKSLHGHYRGDKIFRMKRINN